MQRPTDRKVRSLLRMILSRKTLKTGEVKLMTMRSPIGMNCIAARQAKLMVETETPYTTIRLHRSSLLDLCPGYLLISK